MSWYLEIAWPIRSLQCPRLTPWELWSSPLPHAIALCSDLFQYDSIYFLLVLHHDLKEIHFVFTSFEIVSAQIPSERPFRWGSGRTRLDAIPNWQGVLLRQMFLIAFRGEKFCVAIYTMTNGSHVMSQLDVLSGFRQTLEWLKTRIANSLRRSGGMILWTSCSCLLKFLLELTSFPHCWQGTGVAIEVDFGIVSLCYSSSPGKFQDWSKTGYEEAKTRSN